MVAIGKLIKQVVGDDKGKKRELAMAIAPQGTKTAETAFHKLAELMNNGDRMDAYQEKLRSALGVDDTLFDDAIEDTRKQLQLEEDFRKIQRRLEHRKSFNPHIFMLGERKTPSQITMFGMTGGNRRRIIPLDFEDWKYLSIQEQFNEIRRFIKTHQKEKGGMIPFFGKAVAYLYRPTPEGDGVQFDPQGQVVETTRDFESHFGECAIRIR